MMTNTEWCNAQKTEDFGSYDLALRFMSDMQTSGWTCYLSYLTSRRQWRVRFRAPGTVR